MRLLGYLVFRTFCVGVCTYGGTTQEDPKYPRILSIPDTVCEGMGGQLGRIPSIPGYLVFRTLCVRVWGDNSVGSQVSWDT